MRNYPAWDFFTEPLVGGNGGGGGRGGGRGSQAISNKVEKWREIVRSRLLRQSTLTPGWGVGGGGVGLQILWLCTGGVQFVFP